MVPTIVNQAVQWLEKMGVEVELNMGLEQFEFEYKDTFVILNTDTPEGVLSFTCPYVFPDESSNLNKVIFEEAKNWWAEQISTKYCFCEFVDNDLAYICCLYGRYCKGPLRKYELVEILDDTIQKWELFMRAISSSFNNQLNIKK